jgi:acetolactate synthase small subunit
MEEIAEVIDAKVNVKEVKKLTGDREEEREMALVRFKNEEQKREMWERKRELKERKERVMKDRRWKERRMRWKLEEIARKTDRKGRRV